MMERLRKSSRIEIIGIDKTLGVCINNYQIHQRFIPQYIADRSQWWQPGMH